MMTPTTPINRPLGDGLVLRSLRDSDDAERVATFNGQIFGPKVAEMSRSLMHHHPATRPEHWLYVEDESRAQIVSSLALIPWQWRYEDVTLKSGEMAIVATDEAYRNRGLIRALAVRHQELLCVGEFDLSHIQGIPYFYRQFGYEYAMPLEPGWHLELRQLPDAPADSAASYHFRPATCDDLPLLMRLYEEAGQSLHIRTVRPAGAWQYLFEHSEGTETQGEFWLLLDAQEQVAGYWRVAHFGFGTGLIVSETSRLSGPAAEALLHWLKAAALERNKPYIRFNLPLTNDLLRVAQGWGAHDSGTYAWQMQLVDVPRLLSRLAPVFERRIAASSLAGLTQRVVISLYRTAYELDIACGRVTAVNALNRCDQADLHLPPLLLAPLLLGYRSRAELNSMYPDVRVRGQSQVLVDVLFPRLESFIYSIY
ncbi:MAG: GNAT family N-acetyltransferase [Anaerolineae bacterium]|nr:GNAT family N-acetyltransferase [Anaerolineae bacterium]